MYAVMVSANKKARYIGGMENAFIQLTVSFLTSFLSYQRRLYNFFNRYGHCLDSDTRLAGYGLWMLPVFFVDRTSACADSSDLRLFGAAVSGHICGGSAGGTVRSFAGSRGGAYRSLHDIKRQKSERLTKTQVLRQKTVKMYCKLRRNTVYYIRQTAK